MSHDASLTITSGNQIGREFRLSGHGETQVGRGRDCQIALADDVLCSRVHAILTKSPLGWHVRDCESRNGTFVDEQKIDDALLADGQTIRVGGTELLFQEAEATVTAAPPSAAETTQT